MAHRLFSSVAIAAVASLFAGNMVVAAETATLKGKFVADGTVAAPAALQGTNKDGCDKHKLVDEKVVVSDKNEVANVFVYSRTKGLKGPAPTEAEVVLDNKNCRFEPHALVYQVGQKLKLQNSDPFGHNSNIQPFSGTPVNPLIPANTSQTVEFKTEESLPTKVGCNIHPWMGAWVLIRKDPFAAVSGKDGTFEIKDLPVGKEIEFQFWQESAGNLKNLSFAGGKSDTKGRYKVKLKAGENDLGEIKIPVSAFK
jgi:plastocyanin